MAGEAGDPQAYVMGFESVLGVGATSSVIKKQCN